MISLSFKEIEDIIGCDLGKSAYNYSAYWQPSPTHVCLDFGLSVFSVRGVAEERFRVIV